MRNIALAGAMGALVTAGFASAAVNGVEIDHLGNNGNGETYRMYVTVDAGEQVNAVFGNANPLSIGTAAGMSFYQNALGGNTSTAINSAFFPLAPSLEWDSYVTIGALYAGADNGLLDVGIDWSSFSGGGELATSDGSWFAIPGDAQCFEVGGRVLIGQFTVVGGTGDGYSDLTGVINVQGKDADGNTWQSTGISWIPAPGALALLGVAGLAGRRRRR